VLLARFKCDEEVGCRDVSLRRHPTMTQSQRLTSNHPTITGHRTSIRLFEISTAINMSASKNPDSVTNQQGQFSSRVPGSEPMTTKGASILLTVAKQVQADIFHRSTKLAKKSHQRTTPPNSQPRPFHLGVPQPTAPSSQTTSPKYPAKLTTRTFCVAMAKKAHTPPHPTLSGAVPPRMCTPAWECLCKGRRALS